MPYDVERALRDGVPEEEIAKYLSKTRNYRFDEAVKAGVPHREIIDYLAPQKSIEVKPIVTEPVPAKKEILPSPLVSERPPLALTPPGLARPEVPREIKEPVPSTIDLSGFPKELIPSHEPFRPTSNVPTAEPPKDFGLRPDGTPKGTGFLGVLKRPDGKVSSEISIGVNIDGKEVDIPTLVPTLAQDEIDYLLGGGKPTDAIVGKATEHAKSRIAKGLSPFAQEGEQGKAEATQTKPSALAQAGETIKNLATVYGPVEAAANLASQMVGLPVVGLSQVAGLPFGKSEEFGEAVKKATIYEPKTEAGKQLTEAASYPFKLLDIAGEKAADVTREITGSPVAATAVGTAIKGSPVLLGLKGPLKSLAKSTMDSPWYRSLTIKERGLVTQSLEDMLNKGYSEGEVLRRWKNPSWREEALKRRDKGEEFPPFAEAGKPTERPQITPPGIMPQAPEPVGSMITTPGTPAITRTVAPLVSSPGTEMTPKPPVETPEPVGTTIPIGISPVAPQPTPIKTPPIETPPMGVGPIIPPPQPKPMEAPAPTTPIPQMMGMGQEMPALKSAPTTEVTPEQRYLALDNEFVGLRDRITRGETLSDTEMKRYNALQIEVPYWMEKAGLAKETRTLGEMREGWKKEGEMVQPPPVEQVTPTLEVPPEAAQPITEIPPVLEKPAILPAPEPQIEPQVVESPKRGLSYTQMREILTGTSVKVNGKDAKVNEVNPDGTISVGFKDGAVADVRPEEITLAEPLVGPEVSKEALLARKEGVKEPWQMTLKEFEDVATKEVAQSGAMYNPEGAKEFHHNAVKQALSEGKPVPPEVLADYPDLQSSAIQAIPPTAQHLELMPEEYPGIDKVAVMQDGKVYTDSVHGEIIVNEGLDPEKAIRGYTAKKTGEFVPAEKIEGVPSPITPLGIAPLSTTPTERTEADKLLTPPGMGKTIQSLPPISESTIKSTKEPVTISKEIPIPKVPQEPLIKIKLSEFEETPEKFIPDDMVVDVKAVREKTGEEITIQQNAKEAFSESYERLKRFKDFWDCVKS